MADASRTFTNLTLPRRLSVLGVAAWLLAAAAAGWTDRFNQPDRPPYELLGFIVLPIAIFGAAYVFSLSFRLFTHSLNLVWLVGSHLWRMVGLGFVVGWYVGALPAGFAIPEGLGDIIAAIGALLLARHLASGSASRGWLLAWNVFGLVDLVAAITLGVMYSNGPLGVLSHLDVTTRPMVTFPVSLIPAFFVPLFILLHALTFTRLASLPAGRGTPTRIA